MNQVNCDVVIIGMGIGAAAIARQLVSVGANVSMLPGAGRPRFTHIDGGIISPPILEAALGDAISAPVHRVSGYTVFRRDQLEEWAIDRIRDQVTIIADFEETRVVPHDTGQLSILDDTGTRALVADCVVLTEGANPKIGIASRLRRDFEPEDMIHFGRTLVPGVSVAAPATGYWRTSWGAPAWYAAIPQPEGVLVAASMRVENMMRSGYDARNAVADFLGAILARELGVAGSPHEIGIELVSLKPDSDPGRIGKDNILIALDANGTIDARSLQRYNATLSSGRELGAMMANQWPNLVEWDDVGMAVWDVFTTPRTPYHDDMQTGFIEDGSGNRRGFLKRLLKR